MIGYSYSDARDSTVLAFLRHGCNVTGDETDRATVDELFGAFRRWELVTGCTQIPTNRDFRGLLLAVVNAPFSAKPFGGKRIWKSKTPVPCIRGVHIKSEFLPKP